MGLDNICNIDHCIYSDHNECIECEDGFYYDKLNISCKSSSKNEKFKNCKYSIYGDSCKNGFYLNKSDYLCYSNEEKNEFYKCAVLSENGNCVEYVDEYYSDGDFKCTKIEGCQKSENENKCLKCYDYYCLDLKAGKCEENYYIEDENKKIYYRCNRTNKEGTGCEECIEDFYPNENGICVNENFCEERKKDGTCIKCKNDEDGIFFLNNIYECVEVYFNDNCLVCNNILDFDNCTKCIDGYQLNENNECVL